MKRLPNGFIVRSSDGAVGAHAVLQALPFQESIQPWVNAHFPEATIHVIPEADRVPADTFNFQIPGVVVVQAPKGTGKSKAIRRAVSVLPLDVSVVQVTFRRSLAWSSSTGGAADVYLDLPSGGISSRHHPRLTIVVNSVSRIRGTYDVVVVDELVSVLDMLSSTLLSHERRVEATCTLASLIAGAKTVVVADAMLDAASVEFVMLCRRMNGGVIQSAAHVASTTTFYDFTKRLHVDYTYVPHAFMSSWTAALHAEVAAGRRVVVPCMTRTQAENVAAQLQEKHAASVLLYTARTDGAHLEADMKDLDTAWARATVVVYSPVITAGCSFEREHFDTAFFYGATGMGSVRSANQMIARVRALRTKTVHVYIHRGDDFAPVPETPFPPLFRTAKDFGTAFMALLSMLERHATSEQIRAGAPFAYYFWSLVVHSGAQIVFPAKADAAAFGMGSGLPPGAAALDSSTTLAAPRGPRTEVWCLHDWDSGATSSFDSRLLQNEPCDAKAASTTTAAVSVAGSVLQRASAIPPDLFQGAIPSLQALDEGVVTACRASLSGPPGTPILPGQAWDVASEQIPRVRAWARLMARKAALSWGVPRTAARSFDRAVTTPADSKGDAFLYPPPAASVRHIQCDKTRDIVSYHAAVYISETRTWMDVGGAAWVLAANDVALVSTGAAPSLEFVTMPFPSKGSGVAEGTRIASRVLDVLCRYSGAHTIHVGCRVCGRDDDFPATAALLDVVVVDTEGVDHFLAFRLSGDAFSSAASDLTKLAVLANGARQCPKTIAIAYLDADQFVRVICSPHPFARAVAVTNPVQVSRAMVLSRQVVIALAARNGSGIFVKVGLNDDPPPTFVAKEEASLGKVQTPPNGVLVTWGLGYGTDLERLLRCRLRVFVGAAATGDMADVALNVRHCMACGGPLDVDQGTGTGTGTGTETALVADMNHFVKVVRALLRSCLLVYFWDGRPLGLFVPSMNVLW